MAANIIARNYAETLLALAQRHGGVETIDAYERAIDEVAELLRREPRIREFLATPRVDTEGKQHALRQALAGRVPDYFLRFVLLVVEKRRQNLFRAIADEYRALVDQVHNRVRAEVTLARAPEPELQAEIVAALQRKLGKTVVATFGVDPTLIGGVIVRVGDRVLDGSIRSRVTGLRRRLLAARMPAVAAV